MIQSILVFLSHGGIKLLLIAFFFLMKIARANATKATRREAQLRGSTGISDFSAPESKPAPPTPRTIQASNPPPASRNPSSKSPQGSPWSSNQDPFDKKKP